MTYLHYLTDENGNQIESVYSNNNNKKMSLEANAKIQNATYKIWNKENNEVTTIDI